MTDPADLIAFIDESKKPDRDRKTGKVKPGSWHYVLMGIPDETL